MDLHIMVILLSLYGVSTVGVVNDYVPHIYNSQQRCDNTKSSMLSNLSYSQPTYDKWCFNRQHLTYINVNVIKKNKRSMCKELTSNKNDFKNHVCVLLFLKQL